MPPAKTNSPNADLASAVTAASARPYREFGSWLRSRRQARRWTQEELARQLGYDVTYIRKIEWGERRPSDALRVRLGLVLGVPVSSLPSAAPARAWGRPPEPPGPLIGRADELAAVVSLFDAGARLVTIVGAPGIGKTRLAVALATTFDDRLPGGARFVPLVGVTGASAVRRAIGKALGVAPSRAEDDLDRLVDGLRTQEILLVLDNFEHVMEAAPLVGELVASVPTIRVLVTSRQILDLRFETQFALPPLALAEGDDGGPGRLAEVAAVALFVARARKVHPDFSLDEGNAGAVAAICGRLQGIPLAIELAAAATKVLSPKALLAQLGDGLDLPVAGPQDAPEHQRTLRAAIGWSFELLGPGEKRLMNRLAVFVDGCTLEAVTAVCGLPGDEAAGTVTALLGLAGKSLVQPIPEAPGGARFLALEAVRAYARERLLASGELERIEQRHATWFVELAEVNERRLKGSEQADALSVLEAEHANLRAAIRWALAHDHPTAVRLCAALWRFWWIRGHLAEGRQWLAAALASADEEDAGRARILVAAGVLARTQGAYPEALELLEEGAALSRSIGDRPGVALALVNLGNLSQDRGAYERSAAFLEESRRLYEGLGDDRGVGHSLNGLGTARLGGGEWEAAAAFFEEALTIFRELDDDWSAALVVSNLGWVAHKQGRTEVARSLYERGLTLYRRLGDDRGVANTLLNLGLAVKPAEGGDDVTGVFQEALLTYARLGERRGVAECLTALAAARCGPDPVGAGVLVGAADALRLGIDAPLGDDEEMVHIDLMRRLRDALGDAPLDAAWQQGRMLEIDEVVAVALAGRAGPRRNAESRS